jgi:hypothetical protein
MWDTQLTCSNTSGASKEADFFLWETITCSPYTTTSYNQPDAIKEIDTLTPPWPSWLIVASNSFLQSSANEHVLEKLLISIDKGIHHLLAEREETVEYIAEALDYSKEDAERWYRGVEFVEDGTRGVSPVVVKGVVDALRKAGVLETAGVDAGEEVERMIHWKR